MGFKAGHNRSEQWELSCVCAVRLQTSQNDNGKNSDVLLYSLSFYCLSAGTFSCMFFLISLSVVFLQCIVTFLAMYSGFDTLYIWRYVAETGLCGTLDKQHCAEVVSKKINLLKYSP